MPSEHMGTPYGFQRWLRPAKLNVTDDLNRASSGQRSETANDRILIIPSMFRDAKAMCPRPGEHTSNRPALSAQTLSRLA